MLEFYNYHYLHEKYTICPSSRDSNVGDSICELEKHLQYEWTFDCNDIFAIAKSIGFGLNFEYINREVVDENHLSLEDLLVFFKENKRKKSIFYYNNQKDEKVIIFS